MRHQLINKINIIFAFGLTIILAIGCASYFSNLKLNIFYGLVSHTDKVLEETKSTLSNFQDIETGMRGYVITGKKEFLEPHTSGLSQIDKNIENLESLTIDNSRQQARIGQLKELKSSILEKTQGLIDSRTTQGLEAASRLAAKGESKKTMDKIRVVITTIEVEEHELLAQRISEASRYSKIMTWVIVIGSLLAVGLVLIAVFILNREMNERKKAEQTVQHLNLRLTQKVSELETSNKELESFSYSVSHDLRAPLRTMIGFSSIIIEDHGDILPTEVKANLNRVISATHKMGQLIDGLLDLSKLTRKELLSENVNLSTLADSILKDFQGNEPEKS